MSGQKEPKKRNWTYIYLMVTIPIAIAFVLVQVVRTMPQAEEYVSQEVSRVATAVSAKNPETLDGVKVVTYSEMRDLAASDDEFAAVGLNPELYSIAVTVEGDQAEGEDPIEILYSNYLPDSVDTLLEGFEAEGASVTVAASGSRTVPSLDRFGPDAGTVVEEIPSGGLSPFNLVYFLFLAVLIFFVFRMLRSQGLFGNKKKQVTAEDGSGLATFDDVAGADEAVEDMSELVDYLRNPERYARVGAKVPHGALLVGPPGTGKTLLARALAGEAGAAFIAVAGPDFVEKYVGVGAQRIRSLFKQAREIEGPVILFIDEIDALGRKRGASEEGGGYSTEHEGTLNALLVEMDGFVKNENIIVIGATNRADVLDDALLRPGRLDRKVTVGLPDRRGRLGILRVHTRGMNINESADLDVIARRTSGFSGADLEALINEAGLSAVRHDRLDITQLDLDAATATIAMGRARTSRVISDRDREITAWHEAGHAITALVQPDGMEVVSVSLLPRGQSGGQTWFGQSDDVFQTRKQAFASLVTGLGGMAAEQILFGDDNYTTGPSGDLQQCTQNSIAMVAQYGMGSTLLVKDGNLLGAGSDITADVVREAEEMLQVALEEAQRLLTENADMHERMVEALLEFDTLTIEQIEAIRDRREFGSPPPPPEPVLEREHSEPKGKIVSPDLDDASSSKGWRKFLRPTASATERRDVSQISDQEK